MEKGGTERQEHKNRHRHRCRLRYRRRPRGAEVISERLQGTKGISPAVCLVLWLSLQLDTALTYARALTATLRQLREVVAI